jgi:hypothetical protein
MSLTCCDISLGVPGGACMTHSSPFFFSIIGGALARRISSETALPRRSERALA